MGQNEQLPTVSPGFPVAQCSPVNYRCTWYYSSALCLGTTCTLPVWALSWASDFCCQLRTTSPKDRYSSPPACCFLRGGGRGEHGQHLQTLSVQLGTTGRQPFWLPRLYPYPHLGVWPWASNTHSLGLHSVHVFNKGVDVVISKALLSLPFFESGTKGQRHACIRTPDASTCSNTLSPDYQSLHTRTVPSC